MLAPRRADWSRPIPYGSLLRQRGSRLPQCTAVLRQPLCSLRVRWVARVARLRATRLAFSGEEAQHARLRRARAAPRWLESAHTLLKPTTPAGRPFPSVHGRAPMCRPLCLLGEMGCACSALARHCARTLWGGSAARALETCARRAALVGVGPYPMNAYCVSGTAVTLSARPCFGVPALVLTLRDVGCACSALARHYARSHWEGSAARALPTCTRRAALVGVGPYAMEAHWDSGTAAFLGARPCSDVPAAASKREAYFRMCASQTAKPRALFLSFRRKHSTRSCDVRTLRRAG